MTDAQQRIAELEKENERLKVVCGLSITPITAQEQCFIEMREKIADLTKERDAAYQAGQIAMRERAEKECRAYKGRMDEAISARSQRGMPSSIPECKSDAAASLMESIRALQPEAKEQ